MINLAFDINLTRGKTHLSPLSGMDDGRPRCGGVILRDANAPPTEVTCLPATVLLGLVTPLQFKTRERPCAAQEPDLDPGIPFLGLECNPLSLRPYASYPSSEPQFSHLLGGAGGGLDLRIIIIANICRVPGIELSALHMLPLQSLHPLCEVSTINRRISYPMRARPVVC